MLPHPINNKHRDVVFSRNVPWYISRMDVKRVIAWILSKFMSPMTSLPLRRSHKRGATKTYNMLYVHIIQYMQIISKENSYLKDMCSLKIKWWRNYLIIFASWNIILPFRGSNLTTSPYTKY